MKIYRIIEAKKKKKKKQKSHVGEIGPMYVGKNWSGKLDTRLEPAHRYTLNETGLDSAVKKGDSSTEERFLDTVEMDKEKLIDRLNTIASAIQSYSPEEFYRQAKIWGWNKTLR